MSVAGNSVPDVTGRTFDYSLGQVNRAGDHLSLNITQQFDLDSYIESINDSNASLRSWAKLRRFPRMKLARMEDIGGCRAVLVDEEDRRAVLTRIRSTWELKRFRDYILDPKAEGCRGVHLIVERERRRIEVQLRTTGQQHWADAIENFAGRWNLPLKDGVGPDEILNYFRAAAEGISRDERGLPADPEFEAYFQNTVENIRRWVQEQGEAGVD